MNKDESVREIKRDVLGVVAVEDIKQLIEECLKNSLKHIRLAQSYANTAMMNAHYAASDQWLFTSEILRKRLLNQ